MTRSKAFFSSLEEKDLQMYIELGDDGSYNATRIGIVTFKRELISHLFLKGIMFVCRLRKNLISIEVLEDKGYHVIFSKGKSFIKHVATKKLKNIGARVKNIYKLDVGFSMHIVTLHNIPRLRKEIDGGNLKPLSVQQLAPLNQRGLSL